MGCCSGGGQSRRFTVVVDFCPFGGGCFSLSVSLQGRDGVWSGSKGGVFDFGGVGGCGGVGLVGRQDVSVRVGLVCSEGVGLSVVGTLDFSVGGVSNRVVLPAVELVCVGGEGRSSCVWPVVFFGDVLGSGSVVCSGGPAEWSF